MSYKNKIPLRSINYQWETNLYKTPEQLKRKNSFEQTFGYKIISRNENETANEIKFNLYIPNNTDNKNNDENKTKKNDNTKYYLISNKTNWKEDKEFEFEHSKTKKDFLELITTKLQHKDEYLILEITQTENNKEESKQILRDPASTFFNDKGNSIVWDFEDPSTYKQKHQSPNTLNRATKILQTDLYGLISQWPNYDPKNPEHKDVFKFISTCGVIDKIKELGFNTIQFLPISQSIDGNDWKFRYLSPFPFALQKNWGNPDSFKELVDEFHKQGIAVVLDIILSHAPYKEYKLFNLTGEDIGIHTWTTNKTNSYKNNNINKKENNQKINKKSIFLDEKTTWGTQRFKYSDNNINKYLTESALHFLIKFNIDGFRIDNVDGILRLGPNGQGEKRKGGLDLLKNLIKKTYELNPLAIINLESHYFYEDNAHLLLAPQEENEKALGATAYNSSRLTYYLHTELMPKSADNISIHKLNEINKEKEFTKSNSTIADFHNHDAAANLMEMRATGSYAYDALTLGNENLREHSIGKIKTMEALIAFGTEGKILDLLQTFLLQTGTFDHDNSIHWKLYNKQNNEKTNLLQFKKNVNNILDEPAFWPENTINREFINIDETNKILTMKRKDTTQNTNKEFLIIINFSNKELKEYKIGVNTKSEYILKEITNNEEFKKAKKTKLTSSKSNSFELFSEEIIIPEINSYDIIILEKNN